MSIRDPIWKYWHEIPKVSFRWRTTAGTICCRVPWSDSMKELLDLPEIKAAFARVGEQPTGGMEILMNHAPELARISRISRIYGPFPIPGSDPGDESRPRDTGETERDYVQNQSHEAERQHATQRESEQLMELAKRCNTDELRGEATEALEGVVRSHQPPPPPTFRW